MVVTPPGIVMEVNDVHEAKAELPMLVIEEGRLTLFKLLHPWKA